MTNQEFLDFIRNDTADSDQENDYICRRKNTQCNLIIQNVKNF